MSDGIVFGITLKSTGGEEVAGEVRLSRDALKGLSQESDAASGNVNKLESSNSKLAATSGTTAQELFKAAAAVGAYRAVVMGSIDKTNEQTAALMGLASAARFAGEDITKSMGAANALTTDGLMSMHEAALALKNLLARGFSLEQSVEIIGRFKDSAAFGKQASLEFGEAVVSATEGLKNENSILVDNAGVTKNVSVMWKEYAAQIGVGADQLTQAQKREAEYSGILRETEGQLGNAALASNSLAGSTARLHKATNDAAVAFGTALTPAATGITEAFTYLIDTAVKPLVFGIQMIGINASMASQQLGTSISFITSPSQWNTAGIAAYRKEMKSLADLGEEMAIEAAQKMDGPARAPDIGKDTGARRHDSDPNTAAKDAAEMQKKLDKEVSDLQSAQFKKQMESMGVSAEQAKVYEMAMHGASRAQLNMAQAAAETVDKLNEEEKAQRDTAKAADVAAKLNRSLGSERAGLEAAAARNSMDVLTAQGAARIETERAITVAQEEAGYQAKAEALAREYEQLQAHGELSGRTAELQAQRMQVLEQAHQETLTSIDRKSRAERDQLRDKQDAAAFRADQSLGSERAGLDSILGQNKLTDPDMQGDARVAAERAIAASSEAAKYTIQVDALNRETELMAQRGELTEAIAATQAQRLEVMEEAHQARMAGIQKKHMTDKEKFDSMSWTRQVGTVASKMAEMAQVSATKSRAMFEINKAASLANAVVKGVEAVQSSYAFGASWGGPVGGAIMAGIAVAETAAILAQINSAQFGGGAATAASAGAAGGIPSQMPQTSSPVSVQSSGQSATAPQVTVNLYNTGTFVDAQAFVNSTVIPQIRDQIANADVLLIDPRSRQAQLLGA